MSFGQRLRAIMVKRDYSQTSLARLVKMDQTQLSHFMSDKREPSAENIRRLAKAIDVSADYLLELSDATDRLRNFAPPAGRRRE